MNKPNNISVKRKPFFYDAQIKRVIVQVMSVFAGFVVSSGIQRDGDKRFRTVPIVYGDYDTVTEYLSGGGNENTVTSLPVFSLNLTRLKQSAEFRRAPQHYEKLWYDQRAPGTSEGELSSTKGDKFIIERYMPVPYDMGFSLSAWTSNKDQGFQLIEQVCTYFNPELDLQLSNSPADWIFLTALRFDGDVRFGHTPSDPGGGENSDPMNIYTMDFTTTAHLSMPVKVYDAKLIESVHANIKEMNEAVDFDTMAEIDGFIITGEDS